MPAAANVFSQLLTGLQALIAASPTFQAWVRPDDPQLSAALASVYLVAVPQPADIDGSANAPGYTAELFERLRPFSIVNFAPRSGATFVQLAQSTFDGTYELFFTFEDAVEFGETDDYQDAVLGFMNNVGGVIQDMLNLTGLNGLINIEHLRIEKPLTRADKTEIASRGDYHFIIFAAKVGI